MSYSSYDHDDLEPASTMRIERRIYFESGKADLSEMVKLPLAELVLVSKRGAVLSCVGPGEEVCETTTLTSPTTLIGSPISTWQEMSRRGAVCQVKTSLRLDDQTLDRR